MSEIEPCPNPECGHFCEITSGIQWIRVLCEQCGYQGPEFDVHMDGGYDKAVSCAIRLHNLICRRAPALPLRELVKLDIKRLVDRFLGWKLPENFRPDAGISFKPTFNDHLPTPMRHEPMGTNLFDAIQAEAMLRYVLAEYLEHPSIRGEKSVASFMDKGIMAELEEHAKATLGEDAYIRIYPSDARAILSALSAAGVPSEHAEFWLYCADGDDEYVAAEAYGIRNDAWAEICRYAAQYAQDGPVRIEEIIRIPVAAPKPE